MFLDELYYATRIAVSCACSPPDDPRCIDAWEIQSSRATRALWMLEQRVLDGPSEEKTESWRVPIVSTRHWSSRWKLAIDALVDAELYNPGPITPDAERFLSTWKRVFMCLSQHFGKLRQDLLSAPHSHRHTNTFLHSPSTGVDSTRRRRGTAGRRPRSGVERRA